MVDRESFDERAPVRSRRTSSSLGKKSRLGSNEELEGPSASFVGEDGAGVGEGVSFEGGFDLLGGVLERLDILQT
ncbi:hypothetical protein A0H81_10129 [Grifola frondosa]|uniref:Uncharacterized protein n=1 Tax=Grifola frondosa TaxID=5627 RepID=A0A1C7LXS5_GRIFR|nr:hypothetical protein A0H81_10129 [Grifola frondosa]